MEQIQSTFPLEWLDEIINVTLSPFGESIHLMTNEDVEAIGKRIAKEREYKQFQTLIKSQTFALATEQEISNLIQRYHAAIIVQLDQGNQYYKLVLSRNGRLKDVYKSLLTYLQDSLTFIETFFFKFISLDVPVPAAHLAATKTELRKKLDELEKGLKHHPEKAIYDLAFKSLRYFIDKANQPYEITFREMLYKKELLKGLEDIQNEVAKTDTYTTLDELLIYLNFNSKAYMNSLTAKIGKRINEQDGIVDKMDQLLYHYKAFNQLHRKPDVVLNPKYHKLDTVISNWFVEEVMYLEKKMNLTVPPLHSNSSPTATAEKQKVTCALSVDQMALILRAADELRILVAKSMNQVFKTIVPHLSTLQKENLSVDGVRGKSYSPEERDKEKTIEALEKMIKKIRAY